MRDHMIEALKKMRPASQAFVDDCSDSTEVFVFLLTNSSWKDIELDDWKLSSFIEEEMSCRFKTLCETCTQNRDVFMDMHLERTVAKMWGKTSGFSQFVSTCISKKRDICSLAKVCQIAGIKHHELGVEIIRQLFSKSPREELLSDGLWRAFVRLDLDGLDLSIFDRDMIENVCMAERHILNVRLCEADGIEELSKLTELKKLLESESHIL